MSDRLEIVDVEVVEGTRSFGNEPTIILPADTAERVFELRRDPRREELLSVKDAALVSNPAMSPEGAGTKGAASRLAGASASRSAPPSPQDRGVQPHPLPEDSNQDTREADERPS